MSAVVSVCFTYFKSLTLANLAASLFSLRRQDLSSVAEVVIVDNDTADQPEEIAAVVDALRFPVPVKLIFGKHGDARRTHSWSSNAAVAAASAAWIFFTRADYLLDETLLARYLASRPGDGDYFVTGDVFHLHGGIAECEATPWRTEGAVALRPLSGARGSYTVIDSGVWLARREAFNRVGGLDETLTVWGHAQTHFQWKLHRAGTEFVRIPEVLFFHPMHGASRDIAAAHQQLAQQGVDIAELWSRYEGERPYA